MLYRHCFNCYARTHTDDGAYTRAGHWLCKTCNPPPSKEKK